VKMTDLTQEQKQNLPPGQNTSQYSRLRVGVYDDRETSVWIDQERQFAALFPQPSFDYEHYESRGKALGLKHSIERERIAADRLKKFLHEIPSQGTFLEIGASSGEFLTALRKFRPDLNLFAVEPDVKTLTKRLEKSDVSCFSSMEQIHDSLAGGKIDSIGLFHVFEHIREPRNFCLKLANLIVPGGKIIIEVPSLDDPLLSVYKSEKFEEFYFQLQHPFVYSASSLKVTLEACSLTVLALIPYQRYGLENHLAWLSDGQPGGDSTKFGFLGKLEKDYRSAWEQIGKTDTIIAVCAPTI